MQVVGGILGEKRQHCMSIYYKFDDEGAHQNWRQMPYAEGALLVAGQALASQVAQGT
jgi:hypothetical protein